MLISRFALLKSCVFTIPLNESQFQLSFQVTTPPSTICNQLLGRYIYLFVCTWYNFPCSETMKWVNLLTRMFTQRLQRAMKEVFTFTRAAQTNVSSYQMRCNKRTTDWQNRVMTSNACIPMLNVPFNVSINISFIDENDSKC